MDKPIDAVFFDIGGTLGERNAATGKLEPYASSKGLLKALRDGVGLRVGIITTLGPTLTHAQALAMLQDAGLREFLDAQAFVSDHDAGTAKPDPRIYQFAAARIQLPAARCLYIGENLIEVAGALAAGMKALLKPCPPGRELAQ